MGRAERTREMVKDNKTLLSATDEELKAAEKAIKKDASDAENARAMLAAVRQARANRAAEIKNRASYGETMTMDALIKAVGEYREYKAGIEKQIEAIKADGRFSEAYKRDQCNVLNNKLRDRRDTDRSATRTLLDDIIKAREEYDAAFFTDSARLNDANRIIGILRNAGGNMDIKDFVNLTASIEGDSAAARYIYASIQNEPVKFKPVIESMATDPAAAFTQSAQLLDNMFSGVGQSWGIEQTLAKEAQSVGISLSKTNYGEPIHSDSRNVSIVPEMTTEQMEAQVREAMGIAGGGNNGTETA